MAKKQSSAAVNFFVCIIALVIGFVGAGFGYCYINKPHSDTPPGTFSLHFLELGNIYTGDSTFVKVGNTEILIDAGSKYNSAITISDYISPFITDGKLEYVVATHAHEDHLAGFCNTSANSNQGIFKRFNVGTIIDFPNTSKTNTSPSTLIGKYYEARNQAVAETGATHHTALECYNNANGAQRIYTLENDVTMEILYNYYYENKTSGDDENDYSVCIMFHQGTKHFLFTGDLEDKGERKLVEYYATHHGGLPHCELFKAGHHGSKTSSCTELLDAITPSIVCVCCCCGTSEYTDTAANQFPTQDFINRVAPHTSQVFATTIVDNYVDKNQWSTSGTVKSLNGNIVVTSTPTKTTVEGSNNSTILAKTDWFVHNRTMPAAWQNLP